MDNPRPEKVAVVDEVRERLDSSSGAILTEYRGLSVGELATLRRSLRDAGGEYKVYKNTLVRLAVRDLGIEELEPMLEGPTAITFVSGDAVGVAKALRDFARTNPNLVVKGGLLGRSVLTQKDTAALADVPPREVLLARLAGGMAAPMQQLAGLLQALPRNLAYGLKALIEKSGGAPEAAAPEAAAAEAEPTPVVEDAPVEPAESPAPDAMAAPPGGETEALAAATADHEPAPELAESPAPDAVAEAPASDAPESDSTPESE